MPWVRFTKQFDFFVRHNVVFSYQPNRDYLVKQECARQALEKGKAVLIERPTKEDKGNAVR